LRAYEPGGTCAPVVRAASGQGGPHDQCRDRFGRPHRRGQLQRRFANTPAHDLGAAVIEAVVARAGIDKAEVSETILGQVLTAGQGQNPARQAHVLAGLPKESSAWSINQVCGSGLRAVALGAQHVQLGDAAIVVAAGRKTCRCRPMSRICAPAPRWAT
jgi:acetyl-CoA acetyltransferase